MNTPQGSPLTRSVSGFANALAAIATLLLIPQVTHYLRPKIYQYFSGEFPHDLALWGSWGFVVLLSICLYFGAAAFFQMAVQLLFYRSVRKGGF